RSAGGRWYRRGKDGKRRPRCPQTGGAGQRGNGGAAPPVVRASAHVPALARGCRQVGTVARAANPVASGTRPRATVIPARGQDRESNPITTGSHEPALQLHVPLPGSYRVDRPQFAGI